MAALSPPLCFAAWRVEAFFFCFFLFRWVLQIVLHLIRGVAVHESSFCSREDALGACGRPCDPLSCLLFTALWVRCSQSKVLQETSSAKDVDLTCSITFLFNDATCLPVGPMSLDWPVNPFGRSDSSGPSFPPDASSDGLRRVALRASERSRWKDRVFFKHNHRYYNVLQGGMDVGPSFLKACDLLLGTPGALLDLFSLGKGPRSSNSTISKNFWITTTSFVSKKYMEKTSFYKLSRTWVRDFGSLVHFFQIMKMRKDRHISVVCELFWAISTLVIQKKDDLMLRTKHSLIATQERLLCSIFFPYVLENAQSDYTRTDATALGVIRTLSRIDHIFINSSMAEARDFHCSSHVVENFGKKTIPSDHAAVRLVIQKPSRRGPQNKRIP